MTTTATRIATSLSRPGRARTPWRLRSRPARHRAPYSRHPGPDGTLQEDPPIDALVGRRADPRLTHGAARRHDPRSLPFGSEGCRTSKVAVPTRPSTRDGAQTC